MNETEEDKRNAAGWVIEKLLERMNAPEEFRNTFLEGQWPVEDNMKIISKKPFVHWENTESGHNKFWRAWLHEETDTRTAKLTYVLIRRWGAIGTEGQQMVQYFTSRLEAEDALDKMIWDKERKGYKGVF